MKIVVVDDSHFIHHSLLAFSVKKKIVVVGDSPFIHHSCLAYIDYWLIVKLQFIVCVDNRLTV